MNCKIKKSMKYFFVFIIILFLFITLMFFNVLIPQDKLENNVRKSLKTFKTEGNFPKIKYGINYILDNYTDALMINTAYCIDNKDPINSALLARRNYQSDRDDINLAEVDSESPILNLELTLNRQNKEYYEYSRYWHGYLIYLRPLLLITDYEGIRLILLTSVNILFVITTFLICKKINWKIAIAFIISMVASSIYLIGLSMQYSSIFIIFLSTSIYLLMRNKKIKDYNTLFLVIGAITSFMDLFTCPILTYCIPVILVLALNKNQNKIDLKKECLYLLKLGFFWILGYSITWISKWLITDILCNSSTILSAKEGILRLSSGQNNFSVNIFQTITKNIDFVKDFLIVPLILYIVINLINIKHLSKNLLKENLIYILIGIIPILWYAIIKNHSYAHARYTYKNLIATIFCLLIILFNNLSFFVRRYKKRTNS